jgi:hypothetical protein
MKPCLNSSPTKGEDPPSLMVVDFEMKERIMQKPPASFTNRLFCLVRFLLYLTSELSCLLLSEIQISPVDAISNFLPFLSLIV